MSGSYRFYLYLAAAFVTGRQLTTTPARAIAGKPARHPTPQVIQFPVALAFPKG
jgi:hypothetical protein